MPDPLLPLNRVSRRRSARRLAGVGLSAWIALAGGCMTPGGSSATSDAKSQIASSYTLPETPVPGADDGPSFWERLNFAKPPKAPPPPAEVILLRADGIVPVPPPKPGSPEEQLAGARELFRQGDYPKAEALFTYIADRKKSPVAVAEEARYYEGESLRLQHKLPKAADVYADLLNKFPNSAYREQAIRHMYEIANFWLEDTRTKMVETREQTEGKRWFIPVHWFHPIDPEKPALDEQGRAIEKLEQVRYNDINGPLADQALFLAGSVKFFDQDYREADNYFSQIHEKHPNSPFAERAVELAIISKHLSTGGADYDGRKVAEARKLVQSAFDNYPELATKKKDFLERQLVGITYQQAEKDYKMAEFWKRTGHIGAAYFYFEMVQRRYPTTPFAEKARKQSEELKEKAAKDNTVLMSPPPKAQLGRPAALPDDAGPRPNGGTGETEVAPPPRPVPAQEVPPPPPRPFTPGAPQQ
jgi:outer membrane protein assembly factor BamD (BamD/ComL family)